VGSIEWAGRSGSRSAGAISGWTKAWVETSVESIRAIPVIVAALARQMLTSCEKPGLEIFTSRGKGVARLTTA
jgi:hypothetical protein